MKNCRRPPTSPEQPSHYSEARRKGAISTGLLILLAVTTFVSTSDASATVPTASRVTPPTSSVAVTVGDNYTFTVRGSDSDCDLANAEWFIGSTSIAWHTITGCSDTDSWSYQFNATGTFYVYAYIYDASGDNAFVWWEVSVVPPEPPTATRLNPSGSSRSVCIGTTVNFTVRGEDTNCDLANAEWFLGSTSKAWHSMSGCSDTDSWAYQFSSTGTFYVYAYVYDSGSRNDFVWWEIRVENPAPQVTRESPPGANVSVLVGEEICLTARGEDECCDLENAEWFVASSSQAWRDVSGCVDTDTWCLRPATTGTYMVYCYLYDSAGQDDFVWWEVTATQGSPPTASRISPVGQEVTACPGTTLNFTVGGSDVDCDLANVEWFLGSSSEAWHSFTGCSDTDTWSHHFPNEGNYTVYAYIYDSFGHSDFVWWNVIVASEPAIIATSPDTPTVAEIGETRHFTARALSGCCDLTNVDLYIDDNLEQTWPATGCELTVAFTYKFQSVGDHVVRIVVQNTENHTNVYTWNVQTHERQYARPNDNAAWMGYGWVSDPRAQADVDTKLSFLIYHETWTLYLNVGRLDIDGNMANAEWANTEELLNRVENYEQGSGKDVEIHAWINAQRADTPLDLNNTTTRSNIIAEAMRFLSFTGAGGFTGIHLDIQMIPDDQMPGYLTLANELSAAMEESRRAMLSIAAPPFAPVETDHADSFTAAEYRSMSSVADRLVVMAYNSARDTVPAYESWVHSQLDSILPNVDAQLYWGIPAYKDVTQWHDPAIENVENTLASLNSYPGGLLHVRGLSLYGIWEMTAEEWGYFAQAWLGKTPLPVAISTFTGRPIEDGVELQWSIEDAWEVNAIEVLRSEPGNDRLRQLDTGVIPVRITRYLDTSARPNTSYQYQLMVTDRGGSTFVSNIIRVDTPGLGFELKQNMPNPFNPLTKVSFVVPDQGTAQLQIYDVDGRLVRTLVDTVVPAGSMSVIWDGRDERGLEVSSGIYFYRLLFENRSITRKMTLLK